MQLIELINEGTPSLFWAAIHASPLGSRYYGSHSPRSIGPAISPQGSKAGERILQVLSSESFCSLNVQLSRSENTLLRSSLPLFLSHCAMTNCVYWYSASKISPKHQGIEQTNLLVAWTRLREDWLIIGFRCHLSFTNFFDEAFSNIFQISGIFFSTRFTHNKDKNCVLFMLNLTTITKRNSNNRNRTGEYIAAHYIPGCPQKGERATFVTLIFENITYFYFNIVFWKEWYTKIIWLVR